MILHRVIENLRQQHRMAVSIELAIVVLGVFLGMQVSDWNDERESRQESAIFNARLKRDTRDEAWGVHLLAGYNAPALRVAKNALKKGKARGPDH